MGIHGLWPLLEPTSTAITLDALEGKRLAIDVSFWLYQAQQQDFISKNGQGQAKSPHLMLLLNRIAKLLFYKIRPIFVFDGKQMPRFKKQLLRDRCLKRHLKEIMVDAGQKRKLERAAKEQLESIENSLDGFSESNSKDAEEIVHQSHMELPSTSTSNDEIIIEMNSASCSSDSEHEDGIYSSKIDAQISRLQDVKERTRNARLRPWEIPEDSRQFSQFQLQRLVKRNEVNLRIDKLKNEKIRNAVQLQNLPLNGERKLIVTDKQMRTHVLTKIDEIQIIDPERIFKPDMTWPNYLKCQAEEISTKNDESKGENQQAGSSTSGKELEVGASSSDDEDFIEVSDLEVEDDTIMATRKRSQHSDSDVCLASDIESPTEQIEFALDEMEDSIEESELGNEGNADDDYFPKEQPAFTLMSNDSEGVYADCQKLLKFLGLPFMQAPGEAEAQCAELERLKLVDGIVSDDSDVWLFGAEQVYKNVFSQRKHIQKYSSDEIKQKLGLGRSEFLQLGMLAGGDYTRGFEQVGMVAALELVSEFTPSDNTIEDELEKALASLKKISEWILTKSHPVESAHRIRLRKIIEANNQDEALKMFPDTEVFEAYAKPLVDNSTQKFQWTRVDFKFLEKFIQEKLGLTKQRIDEITHGAFQRWDWDEFMAQQKQSYQARITDFARPLGSFSGVLGGIANSAPKGLRVQIALEKLKNEMQKTESSLRKPIPSPSPSPSRNRKRTSRRGKKIATKKTKTRLVNFTLSEESSADD